MSPPPQRAGWLTRPPSGEESLPPRTVLSAQASHVMLRNGGGRASGRDDALLTSDVAWGYKRGNASEAQVTLGAVSAKKAGCRIGYHLLVNHLT